MAVSPRALALVSEVISGANGEDLVHLLQVGSGTLTGTEEHTALLNWDLWLTDRQLFGNVMKTLSHLYVGGTVWKWRVSSKGP
jgi:hypothetical protein